MRKFLLALGTTIALTGCVSPIHMLTPQEVSALSNQQLCDIKNSNSWEKNIELEVGRRNLNCDPIFNECANRGMKQNTSEMALCMSDGRRKQELQEQIESQQQDLERQRMHLEYERSKNELELRRQAVSNSSVRQPYYNAPNAPQFCAGFPFCH